MMIDEAEGELLKKWLIKKLEDVHAEADSDVLADYVLALANTDEPDEIAKKNCVDNLKDFLGEGTSGKLVEEVFEAIATNSYDPSKPAVKPTAPTYEPPRRASIAPPQPQNQSKKRPYHDWDRDDSQNGQTFGGGRPVKQARRGGGRGGNFNIQHSNGSAPFQQNMPLPQLPTPPPGMPPFDPNNPMAAFMAMQAFGLLPGFPAPGQRCVDYDTKGFCAAGASCPFEHGSDSYVMPGTNEYDPIQASLLNVQPTRTGVVNTSPGRGRGGFRGRGGNYNFRGGGNRAGISRLGPNFDTSITTIVVEQIPEDQFDEQIVRGYFKEFGNIEEVVLQPYKRIATVKYNSYESAKAAYDSPKVIFNNRFVKVYWLKSEDGVDSNGHATNAANGGNDGMRDEESQIDYEELAKKQAEAQRKHEEQQKKFEEAEKQRKDLDAKMKAIEVERKKMADALAKKQGGKATPAAAQSPTFNGTGETDNAKKLKAKLASLEAEAKGLGIDPEATYSGAPDGYSHSPRGRGGFRGRPRGRGGYNPSFRGGWAGARGGGVMRLDNRPKGVAVTFHEGSYEDNEGALRQWLLFNESGSATLAKHPSKDNVALLSFQERYLAEQFMSAAAAPDFQLAGKVDLSWYKPDKPDVTTVAPQDNGAKVEAAPQAQHEEAPGRDLDVADDDDRWA